MRYETIRYEVDGGIATLTFDRPDALNAFNPQMMSEVDHALRTADLDDGVRVVIVTGAGRAFCAGADLGRSEAFKLEPGARIEPWQMRKPVVAAVNGHAIGVGLTFAMQCDVRFVAEDAKLSFVFVRRGVIPELASHCIVPRVAGFANAADLLLSGRQFLGRDAPGLGIANRALPAAEVLDAAREWAREVLEAAPVAVAISKRLLWDGLDRSVPATLARERPLFAWTSAQPDAVEGVLAFRERRAPQWQGSPSDDLSAALDPEAEADERAAP